MFNLTFGEYLQSTKARAPFIDIEYLQEPTAAKTFKTQVLNADRVSNAYLATIVSVPLWSATIAKHELRRFVASRMENIA